jgi:sigma-B regulation protein RsbU (phosphoserine phosphatase)
LVVEEGDLYPSGEDLHLVDDVLVYPFRGAELMSVIRHHHHRVESQNLEREALKAIQDLEQANAVMERILSAKTPRRYTGLKGIQIMSKHLSGLKPGGDYFDVFESERKDFVHFLMVDSSTYGISAAILGMILSSSAKIASETAHSSFHWVNAIYQELKASLGEKGHFSIFFGRLNRRDFTLHYQLHGTIEGYIVDSSGICKKFGKQGPALSTHSEWKDQAERVIQLSPKDRLVLLSDGFVNGAGGEAQLAKVFTEKMDRDPFSLVNELVFRIKSQLTEGDTFPGEDCSAIVIDVENRVLRLAPTG